MKDANGYKIIKCTVIPKCDLCSKPNAGIYDGPVLGVGSSWANMCQECLDNKADCVGVKTVGGKRELIKEVEPKDETVVGNDLTDIGDLINEVDREIECPKCGETRTVEPDADYTFVCTGCGRNVKCASIM